MQAIWGMKEKETANTSTSLFFEYDDVSFSALIQTTKHFFICNEYYKSGVFLQSLLNIILRRMKIKFIACPLKLKSTAF
jgi:hypothetical protein